MDKKLKILTVSCSQKSAQEIDNQPLPTSLKRILNVPHIYHTDNKYGLPFIYNKYITEENYEQYDYIIFAHDDLSIEDNNLHGKIYEAMEQFDVVGLAGTSDVVIKQPALWHVMNNKQPFSGASGAVGHPTQNGEIMVSGYGPSPKRVILLDGLFLAINLRKVLDTGVKFDEQFDFHFYDLDFCLQCNQNKLKLGTWPIWCVHQSPGLSNLNDPNWLANQQKFISKWKK